MGAFFARAWANPATTFGALVARFGRRLADMTGSRPSTGSLKRAAARKHNLAALFVAILAGSCTPAQLAGWQAALSALGVAAPASCVLVNDAAGAPAGKVCSGVAADLSGFAAWLQGVLATLPVAPASSAAKVAPMVVYDVGTVHVELRADLCAGVVARAKAGK